jgi:exosome complex exonuclease DIS3/RRP44
VRQFASEHAASAPELADVVAAAPIDDGEDGAEGGPKGDGPAAKRTKTGSGGGRAKIFAEHLSLSAITAGLNGGTLHQGPLRTNRFSPWEGNVGSDAVGSDILIAGRDHLNRAVDGDVVAVELLPESEWKKPGTRIGGGGNKAAGASGSAAGGKEGEGAAGEADEPEGVSLAPQVDRVQKIRA